MNKLLILFLSVLVGFSTFAGEYLLKFKSHKTRAMSFLTEDMVIKQTHGMFHVELSDAEKKDLIEKYKDQIEYIEPNTVIKVRPITNVESIPSDQWGLTSISADKAWNVTTGSKKVIVAVIDTGIDYNHYAIRDNMWVNPKETANGTDDDGDGLVDDIYGYNFVGNTPDPFDDNSHGTHCAGIIGANSNDLMGISPNVQLMALKFLDKDGSGTLEAAISAIYYAVDHGANVLSNSWGGGGYFQSLRDAIHYASTKGVIFIAAAGNEYNNNDKTPSYPASYDEPNVISVGASTEKGTKAYFSNYGKKTVHVFAPGYNIVSSVPGNSKASYSGTSMATPFVAGLSALYLSNHPNASVSDMKSAIMSGVDKKSGLTNYSITGGQINAFNTVSK